MEIFEDYTSLLPIGKGFHVRAVTMGKHKNGLYEAGQTVKIDESLVYDGFGIFSEPVFEGREPDSYAFTCKEIRVIKRYWQLFEHPDDTLYRANHYIIDNGLKKWEETEKKRIAHIMIDHCKDYSYITALERAEKMIDSFCISFGL